MNRYKLLLLDVDGTLIGGGAYPSERVSRAIAAAREQGVIVALCTGRASEACYHLLNHLRLDGLHIVFDGAAVVEWPSNELVFLHALPPRAARQLITLAREYDLFLEIYAHDFYFVEKNGALAEHQQQKLQINPLFTDLMSLINRVKIVKGQILAADSTQKALADEVSVHLESYCQVSWSLDPSNGIFFGNAVARNVSKANALLDLVDYLGIDLECVIAIGDSYNDIPAFEVAGTSIAMGHAPDKLKILADWVAPSVDADGVAHGIEKFILS